MSALLFRQEAIESGRQRLTGTVVAFVPPRSRHYTIFALATVLLLVLLLTLGSYPRRVEVSGIVAFSAGIAKIVAPTDATIEQIHVEEGQIVERDTPLATLSLSQGQSGGAEGVSVQIAELDRQADELAKQKSLSSGLTSSERASLGEQRVSTAAAIASLVRQKGLLSQQIKLNESQQGRASRLAKQGAGTKLELEESQRTLIGSRLELETMSEKIITKREQLAMIEAQIAGRAINGFQAESQISERMAAIARERADLLRQDRLTLVAPMGGRIGDIAQRAGQPVAAKSGILAVIPKNSKLEVQLYAPSSAVGFVKPGQRVKLMYDAFPYQKFGTGSGVVTWVSTVPTAPDGLPTTPTSSEPVFRIRVEIDRDQSGPARDGLRTGMTLSANLILEDRNLWEVFFGPLFRAARA